MFPVRGDVRLVDGNETLVFTGSQKAISWLNKIFSSVHENSLPTRLQKYARRSSSAPSQALTCSPREFKAEYLADSSLESSFTKMRRPISREKSPRTGHGAGMKKAKAWGSPTMSPSYRDRATSLARQKKSFLRGKRPTTSSPRDSTISSRAKYCDGVRPKSSGILSSPHKRKMWSSLQKSGSPEPDPVFSGTNQMGSSPTTPQRFSITPPRLKSRERPRSAAVNISRESLSPSRTRDRARDARNISRNISSRERKRPPSSNTDEEESPRSFRDDHFLNERMKTLSTSPFSRVARMTISSANRMRAPTSTALMRRIFDAPPLAPKKLTAIPEVLMQRPGTPIRPISPQPMEPKRPWDHIESPTCSTPPEVERSNVTSPAQARDSSPNSPVIVPKLSLNSPRADGLAQPMTPIASDFLRTATSDEESWRRVLSTPNKRLFKNPLFNKILEKKPSTALRSLAHPEMHEIHESSLKQFSSATRKFISKALIRISKVDNRHGSHITTVMCQG